MTACELAIIGTSCRLPGRVEDLDGLWNLLDSERCAVTEIPDDRWTKAAFFSPDRHAAGKAYTFAAGVLDGIDRFDPGFFGLSPREARQMDPQQRLALELAAAAFDDAGLAYDRLAGRDVGVFVGVSSTDYADLRLGDPYAGDAYFMTGSALSIVANRVSYAFDLHGPSYIVDTACSSSLVAFDAARRALADGRVECALVGGVNLLLSPYPFLGFCRAGMLSPSGRCRPFDAAGDGYVRAEGGGFVVLKPLAHALADGDRIHAVVRASGTNADGRTAGLSLPDHRSQRTLLERIYGDAGLDPARLVYLEAHGTGTAVGDPAEATSIGEALAGGRGRREPLPIGSIKGNIGHLEPASGMAGLFKAIALLAHRRIPPSLFFDTPNPAIDFARLGLRIVDRGEPFEPCTGDLVGINSFGFGGANAHVVLEAPPPAPAAASIPPATLPPVIVTAHTRDALAREARAARAALLATDTGGAYDQVWTRAFRRRFETHRLVVDAGDVDGAARGLDDDGEDADSALARRGEVVGDGARTAFVFSGNGSQWVGMGRRLLAEDAAFRAVLREVDAAFSAHADFSIETLVAAADDDDLAATERAQPMLFALQVAIARRLEAFGLAPDVVLGHSVGEVAAAHVAGLLTLEDAVAVIFHRSHAQGLTRGQGRMMALSVEPDELAALLAASEGEVEVAGINAPGDYTLAGPEPALAAIAERWAEGGRFAKLLELDYAFHSRAMAPVEATIEHRLAHLRPLSPRCEMISAVTAAPLDPATLARSYWWRNIREPVAFAAAFAAAVRGGPVVAVEIGPKPVLAAYMRKVTQAEGGRLAVVPSLAPGADGPERLRAMVADAFVAGAAVDWTARFPLPGRVAKLPARALEREPYWFASSGRGTDLVHPLGGHPLLGFRADASEHRWERDLDLAGMAWLADHRVGEQILVPAAGFAEVALAAAAETFGPPDGGHRLAVNRLDILRPLRLEPGKIGRSRVELAPLDGRLTVAAAGGDARSFAPHVTARVERVEAGPTARRPRLTAAAGHEIDPVELYRRAERLGLHYGPGFRRLATLRCGDDVVTGELDRRDDPAFLLAPAVGDAALQALLALLPPAEDTTFLPVGFARLELLATEPAVAFTARVVRRHRRSFAADVEWCGADGAVVARATAWRFRAAPHLRADPPARLAVALRPRAARARDRAAPPEPAVLLDAARRAETGVRAGRRTHYREETAPLLAAAAADYARRALAPAFARIAPKDFGTLAATLGCPSDLRPLLRRLVAMLEEDGRLLRDPEGWRLVENDELPAAEPILRAVVADSPEHAVDALLMARAGEALADTLTGNRDPNDERLEDSPAFAHWQHGSPVVGDGRRALLAAVDEVVRGRGEGRFLRVLNVSAGDAAFARALAERLPAERSRLVHLALTHRARATLDATTNHRAFVQVEEHPLDVAEVVAEGDFDLVVANHALHVTRDDDSALGALRLSLAPGGVALISERQVDRLADMVFEGSPRWLPAAGDVAVRPRVGTAHHWVAALEAAGFGAVYGPEDPAEVGPGEGFVVAAARPQKEAQAPAPPPPLRLTGTPELAVDSLARRLDVVGDGVQAEADGLWWLEPVAASSGGGATAARLIHDVVTWLDAAGEPSGRRWVALRTPPVDPAVAAAPSDPTAAALWGAMRVAANERPKVDLRLVELRGFVDAAAAARALAAEICESDDTDDEVVLTPASRFVPRLAEPDAAVAAASSRAAVLEMPAPGALNRLVWRPLERRAPGPGEVEIAVEATGLNFRDVMLALGLLGDDAVEDGFAGPHLGMECAGTIAAVGAEVDDFAVGDDVVAFAPACFATHVTTATTAVAKRPEHLPAEAAATLPTVFFSAYYALAHLGRVQPGETVLIHGAAGGVGLAAVQIAHALGAHVVVTAGSAEKQAFLRLLGLERIATSRSLRFADEIDDLTAGEGVDVVLNALAGAAIEKSLALLKPFGRFLELGKRDLYADSPIGLAPFRRNVSYFGVDADQLMAQRPALARAVFREVLQLLADGALRPIPYRAFDAAAVSDAFALMQTARHIGKVVVRIDDPPVRPEPATGGATFTAEPIGWYVVTGGLAGFGLATACWLAERGARRLALWSRRGGVDGAAREAIATLRADGVEVETAAVDVTDAAAVEEALAVLRAEAPIRGVVHAAAVFDDAPLAEMDVGRLERVLAPKLDGARVLDRATAADRLGLFVVYSSATTALGNPGQANYVAANLALESLAAERRARGLPALAVAWGPIADVGILTRNEAAKKTLAARFGRRELDAATALDALGRLLAEGTGDRLVAHLDWGRLRALPGLQRSRRFDELIGAGDEGGGAFTDGGSLEEQLAAATPEEAQELLVAALGGVVAGVLGLPADRVAVDTPLTELGMDSLMGVELAMAFKDKAGIELPMTGIGEDTTIRSLAREVVARLHGREAEATARLDPMLARHGAEAEAAALAPLLADDPMELENTKMQLLP